GAQLDNRNGGLIFYFNKNEKVTNENYKNVSLTFDVKIINRKHPQMYFLGFWNQAWEGEKVENTINIQDTDEWQTVTTCLGDFENKQNFGFKDLRGIKIAPYCDWDWDNPISTYPTMWIKNVRLTLADKKELTGTLGTYVSGSFTPVTELVGGQKIQSRLHYKNGLGEKRDLTIVTAVYKDDVLVDLRSYKSPNPAASGDKDLWHSTPVTLPNDVTGYKVTTMLWDNLENMNALLDCETVSAAPVQ
ncbi:MAG: hypothetical protein RR957_08455, partial [Oscillospiraceae bacterium]